MAKKTKNPLLKEGTVRRMMKLANMEVLGDNFLSEKYSVLDEESADLEERGSKKGEYKRRNGHRAGDVDHHYKAYEKNDSLEEEEDLDIEAAEIEEPGEDIEAMDIEPEESPAEVEAEVTVADADVDALKTARDVLDQVISAAGPEEGEEELEMDDLGGEEVEEIGAEVEDLEDPGSRNDMDLYEAALAGLGADLVDDKAEKLKSKLQEVKTQVYKRVIERLLKESKQK